MTDVDARTFEAQTSDTRIIIRRATIVDVPQIFQLVNQMARIKNNLLPRSMAELYEHMRDFLVAVQPQPNGSQKVVGTCALSIIWDDLAEVRSLAVDTTLQGQGLGERLLAAITADAEELGLTRLFALTTIPRFFLKYGYYLVAREQLPQKTWSECFRCPKFTACDETAVVYDLSRATSPVEIAVPDPTLPVLSAMPVGFPSSLTSAADIVKRYNPTEQERAASHGQPRRSITLREV